MSDFVRKNLETFLEGKRTTSREKRDGGLELVVADDVLELLGEFVRMMTGKPTTVERVKADAKPGLCRECGRDVRFIKMLKTGLWYPAGFNTMQVATIYGDIAKGPEIHKYNCPIEIDRLRKLAQEKHAAGEPEHQPLRFDLDAILNKGEKK